MHTVTLSGWPQVETFGRARAVLGFVCLFGLVYNISFTFNESLSTGRMAILLLTAWWLLERPLRRPIGPDPVVWLLFVPLPYVVIQAVFSGDFGQVSRFVHLFLYSVIGGVLIARGLGNLNRVMMTYLAIASVQALILFYSFVSLEYRAWVDANIVSGANFGADHLYRAPGFSSGAGSNMSLIQSLGVLAGGVLLFRRRQGHASWPPRLLIPMMLLCMASCIVVGRTGLVTSAVFFLMFAVAGAIPLTALAGMLAVTVAGLAAAWSLLVDLLPDDFSLDWFLGWAFGFMKIGRAHV
jgi:hypothetical protein